MFEEKYKTLEEIPAAVKHLFVKLGDEYVLLRPGQLKTDDDVGRVQEGLRKERQDHKETRLKLAKFDGLEAETVLSKLDRFDELEAAAEGKLDETKIAELVEVRLRSATAPLNRQIEALTTDRDDQKVKVEEYKKTEVQRTIHDHIRKAGVAAKIRDTAMEDALMTGQHIFTITEAGTVVTKDSVGVTPGVDPAVWFTEVKATRPHWWPDSHGADAPGATGRYGTTVNPFAHDNWNLTEQGKLLRADRKMAEQMAKSAGTTIGGGKPQKKA